MAIVSTTTEKEVPDKKAIGIAKTGQIIDLGPTPDNIEKGRSFAHMNGLMTHTEDKLYLNSTFICHTDRAETHSSGYYPFYDGIIMCRLNGRTYEFYYLLPPPNKDVDSVPKPAFKYEADELEVISLTSGRGLVLIEKRPNQRIVLMNKFRFIGTKWNKISKRDIAWEGPHELYTETPNSVVIGKKMSAPDGTLFTRFYKGHDNTPIYNHPGPEYPTCWVTDEGFFFKRDILGEEVVVSAKTGEPIACCKDELYVVSKALVRRRDAIVEANSVVVSESFVTDQIPPVAHASGLLYIRRDRIKMLVIKDPPQENTCKQVPPSPSQ
jgi:hypothetical protein